MTAALKPPLFDAVPVYTDGVGCGWSGYGIWWEWPSASLRIWFFKTDD